MEHSSQDAVSYELEWSYILPDETQRRNFKISFNSDIEAKFIRKALLDVRSGARDLKIVLNKVERVL